MPYAAGHRNATRQKIIDSARRLFNERGFDNVSVKQIMAGAGLTHGGFYDYFKGKTALYTEVLSCFLTDPNWVPRWEGVSVDLGADDAGAQIIRAYLSRQHFADIGNSCPMVALPTDVRRNGTAVKSAFETVFVAMVRLLEQSATGTSRERHETAQGIAALCVGGLVVARAGTSHPAPGGRITRSLHERCAATGRFRSGAVLAQPRRMGDSKPARGSRAAKDVA
jgi:TetR/AcrR family transcriptional regulator, transcriptional repressor for nem operon